jgi:hypothetical protein
MKFMNVIKSKNNKNNGLVSYFGGLLVVGILTITSFNSFALDTTFSLHKGDESKTKGFSLSLADSFTKGSNFYWSLGYNALDDVEVEWNNDTLYFGNDTVEALVSYRHQLKSYNAFFKKVSFEYQVGASVALTENKFTWEELNEDKLFSEKGDINAVIGVSAYYNFNKNTAVVIGLKHQPSFSEFDDISSAFIGINYKFGKVVGY